MSGSWLPSFHCDQPVGAEPVPVSAPFASRFSGQVRIIRRYVYVFEPVGPDSLAGRLAMRRVPMLRTVNDRVLVDFERSPSLAAEWAGTGPDEVCELHSGDEVVISPLPRAVEGMRLRRPAPIQVADLDQQPFLHPEPDVDPLGPYRPPPLLAVTARAGGEP